MPFYSARGVGVYLYPVLSSPPTSTDNTTSSARNNAHGRLITATGQDFGRGARLTERRVAFPGADQDRALNWLGDAPFWQVEVGGDSMQVHSNNDARYGNMGMDSSTTQQHGGKSTDRSDLFQTYMINISLSERSFRSHLELQHSFLKLEVFVNGRLSLRRILRHSALGRFLNDTEDVQHHLEIILHPDTPLNNDQRVDFNEMRITRWQKTCDQAKNEAKIRLGGEAGHGPSAQFLRSLGSMQMPFQVLKRKNPVDKELRIVDVVITFGDYDTDSAPIKPPAVPEGVKSPDDFLQKDIIDQTRIEKLESLGHTTSTDPDNIFGGLPRPAVLANLDFGMDGTNENLLPSTHDHIIGVDFGAGTTHMITQRLRLPLAPVIEQGRAYPDFPWAPNNHTQNTVPRTLERPFPTSSMISNSYQGAQGSLQSHLPPMGLYQVTQKPKPKVRAKKYIAVSRLAIRGKDGQIVIERCWSPPKRIKVNPGIPSEKPQMPGKETRVPVSQPSSSTPKTTLVTPPLSQLPFPNTQPGPSPQQRPFSSSILGIQGPKANPYVFDDPEEVLRMNKRQRTAARHKDGGLSPVTTSDIPAPSSGDVITTLNNTGMSSPLSSLSSTPTFGSMFLPPLPFSSTTNHFVARMSNVGAHKDGSSIGEGRLPLTSQAATTAMMIDNSGSDIVQPRDRTTFLAGIDAAQSKGSEPDKRRNNSLQSLGTLFDAQYSDIAPLVAARHPTVTTTTKFLVAEDTDHQHDDKRELERPNVESDDGFQEEYVMCSFRYFIHG